MASRQQLTPQAKVAYESRQPAQKEAAERVEAISQAWQETARLTLQLSDSIDQADQLEQALQTVQARLAAAETEAVSMQSDNEVQVAGLAARLQSIVQEHQAAKSGLHIKLQAMQQICKTQVGELTRRLQSVHSEHQAEVSDLSRVLQGVQQKLTADTEQVRQQLQPDTPDDNSVSCAPVSAAQHEAKKTKAHSSQAKLSGPTPDPERGHGQSKEDAVWVDDQAEQGSKPAKMQLQQHISQADAEVQVDMQTPDPTGTASPNLSTAVTSGPTDSTVRVQQMASPGWQEHCIEVAQRFSMAWPGRFDMIPVPCNLKNYVWPAEPRFRVLGQGNYGKVFYGQRRVSHNADAAVPAGGEQQWEAVAIKVLPYSKAGLKELSNLTLLASRGVEFPHLIHMLDCDVQPHSTTSQPPYILITSRFVEGDDLRRNMMRMRDRWLGASKDVKSLYRQQWVDSLREVMVQALHGLNVLHEQGLVHGDIKPDNLRLHMQPDGSGVQLVILDLGSAVPQLTDAALSCGVAFCPYYASPEALCHRPVRSQNVYSDKMDVWGLGCCLFQMVAGIPAFGEPKGPAMDPAAHTQQAACWQDKLKRAWCRKELPSQLLGLLRMVRPEQHVYDQILDMIFSMLQYNPDYRASAAELLMHEFLWNESNEC